MTIYLALLTAVFILGSFGIPRSSSIGRGDVLSHDATACINGYFISWVFLRHLMSYAETTDLLPMDGFFVAIDKFLGQLIVATFLFFSGYGVMESMKQKGDSYIRSFPIHRIMPFLLDVWLALAVYVVVGLVRGTGLPSVSKFLLSMVGWEGLGNSNWYIFAILSAWVLTYIVFRIINDKNKRLYAVALLILLTFLYCMLMRREEVGTRFYNTILCYPAGMILSLCIERIRMFVQKNHHGVILQLLATTSIAVLFYCLRDVKAYRLFLYNARAIVFVLLIIMVSLCFTRVSKSFLWAGKNLFFLYIYQRVPMILLRPFMHTNVLLYITVCLICTVLICIIMSKIHAKWRGFFLGQDAYA